MITQVTQKGLRLKCDSIPNLLSVTALSHRNTMPATNDTSTFLVITIQKVKKRISAMNCNKLFYLIKNIIISTCDQLKNDYSNEILFYFTKTLIPSLF